MIESSIADYGFLSNCQSAALVSRDGSVDWYCTPRFDSPPVFTRLLDADGGEWSIRPVGACATHRAYVGDSLVLRTEFETATGAVTLTDALPFQPGQRGHDIGLNPPHLLMRRVEGLRGRVRLAVSFRPRFEFGLSVPHIDAGAGLVTATAGPTQLRLRTPVSLIPGDGEASATFEVSAGDQAEFLLQTASPFADPPPPPPADVDLIREAVQTWESWLNVHSQYQAGHRSEVRRSALVLQGLTYRHTGAVMAAPTSSLPEVVGGDANWDYRYAWLRDLSLTMRALWVAACPDEATELFDLVASALGQMGEEPVQIMFGIDGRRDLTEHSLQHLAGYRNSRPVRVGNDAWHQRQLDILGEVVDAVHLLREPLGEFSPRLRELVVHFANRAERDWRLPGAGMWERRDTERHYVSSKVLLWVCLDRAIKLADRLVTPNTGSWERARDEIRADILARAWRPEIGAYAGAYDSDQLDASVLLMPLVGFLPANDARMAATIRRIERDLGDGILIRRWAGDANGFLLCSYWLVECLALLGEVKRAQERFEQLNELANDLGLLAEMADPRSGEPLGNFPQAFSHIGLVNAAWRLAQVAKSPLDIGVDSRVEDQVRKDGDI